MARDGAFFRFAGDVHPRFRVPSTAIMLQGLVAIVIVLVGRFEQILTYMGFSLGIFPLLAVIGLFELRRAGTGTFRAPGFPIVPALYVVASGSILVLAYLERPLESTVSLATVAAGVPAYAIFRRTNRTAR
jgi:APA family basic amino acid/polyamine antiporter